MHQRDDLVFPMAEYERRLRELRERMLARDLEVIITTTPENICYLTGFESPGHYYFNAVIVPVEGEPVAVPRYLEDSGYQALTWVEQRRPYRDNEDPMAVLQRALDEFKLLNKRIGFEKDCWFFTAAQQERLFAACPNTDFVDCTGIIEAGRLIKSSHEIELMKQVARTTEIGMQAGIDTVAEGVSEHDIAAEIHYALIKAGSEWPSIVPFVASGERGAIGHATWMERIVQNNDCVFLEVSGCRKRYHAALMRAVFVGKPSENLWEAERVVQEAMLASLDFIKPGVTAHEVDAIGRAVISKASFGVQQISRSGYSIGIGLPPDWGEGHILSFEMDNQGVLKENMTFHLIPWVQVPGMGGIGFSETIQVTADGCKPITNLERKLFVK